jgi:hypothetical protein
MLGDPHLVLPDVRRHDGIRARVFTHRFYDVARGEAFAAELFV